MKFSQLLQTVMVSKLETVSCRFCKLSVANCDVKTSLFSFRHYIIVYCEETYKDYIIADIYFGLEGSG